MEKHILRKLNFCVDPPTPYTHCQHLVQLWHSFLARRPFSPNLSRLQFVTGEEQGANLKLRALYEQLDRIYLRKVLMNQCPRHSTSL